ncbi:tyrosine-type recombinase/integrase [Sedimentimonas flavescens]|uniref:Tyrosine-type recombinase/integrase n=1 Tax=Sedimentimonas flavescens TaxID=2851012 RepID=A0ABT2ZV59_9RHOB|nr:tyrosine-type recombinase/integrase [Sedimentimonas flavescens]MCV2877634.1 tyrosine-type recombinase/integrase [Sedimentimonas flavescens]
MAKLTIRGVFSTYKTLADGSRKTYWYHRATGKRLPGNKGSAEWIAAYVEAEKLPIRNTGTVAGLIRNYVMGRKFTHTKRGAPKAESTLKEYRRMLTAIETRFGTLPIKALESPRVNAIFIDYHEEIAFDRPREADNRMTVLCAVFNEAKRRGEITRNPLDGFERAYISNRAELIWTEADITRFMIDAPLELQQAMILAIHTGQRYGDLIRLRWSDYDNDVIRLVQSKTKAKVPVPVSAALKRMLSSMPRQGPFILTRADGRPWHTERNDKELGKSWRRHMASAGFYPKPFEELSKEEKQQFLHFNDLRGTAVTLLTEAGCTIQQVCSITGHTLDSATRILRHYLASTEAIARSAILRFENAPETSFANQLQTGPQSNDRKRQER